MTEALKGAVQTMEAADYGVKLWADDVRQQAEERLGLTAGDEMVLDDEEYGAALAAGSADQEDRRTQRLSAPGRSDHCGLTVDRISTASARTGADAGEERPFHPDA